MSWAISITVIFLCCLGVVITAERRRDRNAENELRKLLNRLRQGRDPNSEQAVIGMIKQSRLRVISKRLSAAVYRAALDNLSAHPGSLEAKDFVVQVGRWHLARTHSVKRLSADDDQTLRQDIFARCRGR